MRHIRRYIYSLLILKTIVIALILASILWIIKALKLLDVIAVKGVSLIDFIKLSGCLLPYILYLILPFAAVISLAVVYRVLDSDNELLVLKVSGITKAKLVSLFSEVFIIFSILGLLISSLLIPISYKKFQQIILNYQNYYLATFVDEKSFNSDLSGLTFYIDKKDGEKFEGIFINDHRSSTKEISIFAESGELQTSSYGATFTLFNGIQFERKLGDFENQKISNLKFDIYNLKFDYTKALQTIKNVEHQELGILQLLQTTPENHNYNTYRSEGIKRIIWPLLSFILPLISLSISINSKFSRRVQYKPIILSFFLPFIFVLFNVYTMSFANSNGQVMIWIALFNIIIASITYIFACKKLN